MNALLVWAEDAIPRLLPVIALAAVTLVRRALARHTEPQPWVDAAVATLMLVPLATIIAWPASLTPARAALAAGLSVALLAHDPRDLPQTEVALKIM